MIETVETVSVDEITNSDDEPEESEVLEEMPAVEDESVDLSLEDEKYLSSEEITTQTTVDNPSNLPADWEFGTITLLNQEYPDEAITIMDRNLWATSNDITSTGSYGWYYQWWRNYGFPGAASCESIDDPDWDGDCPMSVSDAELFDDYSDEDYDEDNDHVQNDGM